LVASAAVVASSVRRVADRRWTVALGAAAACALGLAGVGVLALGVRTGHERDAAMLHGFTGLHGSRVDSEIRVVARLADPVPYASVGLLCIAVALVRRRTWRAVAAASVLVGTGLTTHALKHLLAQPRYADWLFGDQIEAVSWPSGHATAAMTLALCAVIVAPPAWRTAVALLGGACALGLAYATLALTWHYPSDVFGGFLVAGLWVSLALAVLARLEAGEPEPGRWTPLDWLIAMGAAGALVAAALVGVASERVTLDNADRVTVIVGALALAALAVALSVATVVAASERDATDGRDALPDHVAPERVPSRA
jgi:membrane-associated phospholipid phosphatase